MPLGATVAATIDGTATTVAAATAATGMTAAVTTAAAAIIVVQAAPRAQVALTTSAPTRPLPVGISLTRPAKHGSLTHCQHQWHRATSWTELPAHSLRAPIREKHSANRTER